MDILARRTLYAAGLDYAHGTGHGVGSYAFCHEGPIGVNYNEKVEFKPGHCVSDEPGYYRDGEFGIRIENVIMCQKHPKFENFLCWENLTVAPYSRNLIDKSILDPDTITFIDNFHQKCLTLLTPFL